MTQGNYQQDGFLYKAGFFSAEDLDTIEPILRRFHAHWLNDNAAFYRTRAINSAYITGPKYLDKQNRLTLFQFIGQDKLVSIAENLIKAGPAFMNTQLFFNPHNQDQKNYWHRDIQYGGMRIEEQMRGLITSNVPHFRVPLADEPGIELVPGSHVTWDTDEEYDVRMEQNGKKNHDPLSSGKAIRLKRGDLLVFSANMIHRGLYGGDRFAFDIMFCDPNPDLLQYVDLDCLPDREQMQSLNNPDIFEATLMALNG